jgi:hypothetical protein
MKFLTAFIFTAALMACGQNDNTGKKEEATGTSTEPTAEKKEVSKPAKTIFDIRAAKIVFNYTGPESGTETLYFDEYGERAVLVVDKKSKYSVTRQTIIWKDKKSTIINHENKTVATSPFRPKATEPPGIADADEKTRNNIGYQKQPDETVAGKTCEVWFNAKQNIKYWLWNKLDLKIQNQGVYTKEANSAEEISSIPETLFEIPKDYKQ